MKPRRKPGDRVAHADGTRGGVLLGLAERSAHLGEPHTLEGYWEVSFFKGTLILKPIHESMLQPDESPEPT